MCGFMPDPIPTTNLPCWRPVLLARLQGALGQELLLLVSLAGAARTWSMWGIRPAASQQGHLPSGPEGCPILGLGGGPWGVSSLLDEGGRPGGEGSGQKGTWAVTPPEEPSPGRGPGEEVAWKALEPPPLLIG